MHMADALLSPTVGGAFWAATIATIMYAARKLKDKMDEKIIPLMGVLGAFIFAGQMINFTIPGTGSSGHIGGGMLLAVILGPYAGFLVMASVLTIQALFFPLYCTYLCTLVRDDVPPAFRGWRTHSPFMECSGGGCTFVGCQTADDFPHYESWI